MIDQSQNMPIKAQCFVVIMRLSGDGRENLQQDIEFDSGYGKHIYRSHDNKFLVAFSLRKGELFSANDTAMEAKGRILLGDDAEWPQSLGKKSMANAVFIEYDLEEKRVSLLSSIVALPPVFMYRDESKIVMASDMHLLSRIPGVRLLFDTDSIRDVATVGHPVQHRTLFRNVSLMPGGFLITLHGEGQVSQERCWRFKRAESSLDWNSYLGLQIAAFKNALQRIDITNSFFSLTGGLDTRTIFAALVQEKRALPAFTLSGSLLTLDARIARDLCHANGLDHRTVILDRHFFENLPRYVMEACRLSGGLASLDQAHEVFFYESIGNRLSGRLCGNLGNQVGRGGMEKLSMRRIDTAILNEALLRNYDVQSEVHWYNKAESVSGYLDTEFLIQQEVPHASVANYCIGNHFAVQQSPYANCEVIENIRYMPGPKNGSSDLSLVRMRIRDLRHRFLGESSERSFQIRLIKEAGGFAASYPINWGWRAKGGVSARGIVQGTLTFIDVLATSRGLDSGFARQALGAFHITGLHEYKSTKLWVRSCLRDFIYDTLRSSTIRGSGLFNDKQINIILDEHYSGKRCHLKEVVLALDLALAKQLFHADV